MDAPRPITMGWSQPDEAPSTRPTSAMTAGIPQTTKVKERKMGEGALAGQQTVWHALHVPSHTLPQQLHPSSMHLEQPWQNRSQGLQSRAAMGVLFLLQPCCLRLYRAVVQGASPPTFFPTRGCDPSSARRCCEARRRGRGYTHTCVLKTQSFDRLIRPASFTLFDEAGPSC